MLIIITKLVLFKHNTFELKLGSLESFATHEQTNETHSGYVRLS